MKTHYTIRLAEQRDVRPMLDIYAPFITHSPTSFEEVVPSEEEFWQRIQATLQEAPWLVCQRDDEVIGYAYASSHRVREAYRWTRELSAYIKEGFRGKNVATALYTTLLELLKLQGYANTLIGITLPNEASIRFHEKMGFSKIGVYHQIGFKHGRYHDVGWWELPIRTDAPGEIRSIDAIQQTTNWQTAIEKGVNQLHL